MRIYFLIELYSTAVYVCSSVHKHEYIIVKISISHILCMYKQGVR